MIIHYKIISQSNVFFTTKNFLVVLLQLYRVCVIIIEHRKRQRLAHLIDAKQYNQYPISSKASFTNRHGRSDPKFKKSTDSVATVSNSMINLRPYSYHSEISSSGNTEPLSRRKPSSALFQNPPPLPEPRPSMLHSKSSAAANLNNSQICTEV